MTDNISKWPCSVCKKQLVITQQRAQNDAADERIFVFFIQAANLSIKYNENAALLKPEMLNIMKTT